MKAEFCPVSGKVKFASMKLAAAIALRDARRVSRHRKSGLTTYRCTACKGFHIGRSRELKMARKARRPQGFSACNPRRMTMPETETKLPSAGTRLAEATQHVGQFKLWNVPQTDPFVGQPAFVVRTGTRDAIYADFVSAKGSTAGRSFVMTDHNNTPLYAG